MNKKLLNFFRRFTIYPDWMLKKEIFVLVLCVPAFYFISMTLFTVKSLKKLTFLEKEVVYLENLFSKQINEETLVNEVRVEEDYLKKFIEKITFLSMDRKQLALLCSEVTDGDLYVGVKERLSFLESVKNRLCFLRQDQGDNILWKIQNPMEMNCSDIKRIVTLIEGKAIEPFYPNPVRPNIYFSKLKIKKLNKGVSGVYRVDFQVFQRGKSEKK